MSIYPDSVNSERGEHVGIFTPFQNASENSNMLHVSSVNDETRNNISDEGSELSVPKTRFDRQAHTHHSHSISQKENQKIPDPKHNTQSRLEDQPVKMK